MKNSQVPLLILSTALLGVWVASNQRDRFQETSGTTTPRLSSSRQSVSSEAIPPRENTEHQRALTRENGSFHHPVVTTQSSKSLTTAEQTRLSDAELQAKKLEVLDQILSDSGSFSNLPEEHRNQLAAYAGQFATSSAPVLKCWSPGTSPEIVRAYMNVEQSFKKLSTKALQGDRRWERTATNPDGINEQGLPTTIRWSIVPDGTSIETSGGDDTSDPSNLRDWLADNYGGDPSGDPVDQPWFPILQSVFGVLSSKSGLNFVYEPADDGVGITNATDETNWGVLGVRGDIRVSGHRIDGNSGILAYAYYPDHGDTVIDTSDNFYDVTSVDSLRLRNVLAHEIGHSIGMAHVCPVDNTKLMEPFASTSFDGPQFDDIYTQQRSYGDPFERNGELVDNDTAENATELPLLIDEFSRWEYLSIDNATDTDFFAFSGHRDQQLTVRVIPSDPIEPEDPDDDTYLEGGQLNTGACAVGTPFNPTNQQDLVLDLIAEDGVTVIATATAQPAGVTEEIAELQLISNGTQYIRVRGGTADRAQLYTLEAALLDVPRVPDIVVTATRLDAESNSGANGLPDPGETLRYGVTLTNVGGLAAQNISATVSLPDGSTAFDAEPIIYPDMEAEGVGTGESLFIFSVNGLPGETVSIGVNVTADGYTGSSSFLLTLGESDTTDGLGEDFDGSPGMPPAWSQFLLKDGLPWSVTNARSTSPNNSIHTGGILTPGESSLVSPTVTVGADGGVLQFSHRYILEEKRDGAILEASRDGAAWFDLMTSEAQVVRGDYNDLIFNTAKTRIGNQMAWTGASGGFINTRVILPEAWAGDSIAFRWSIVHDKFVGQPGWTIDDVRYFPNAPTTEQFRPTLSLTGTGLQIDEENPLSITTVTVSTPLPLAQDVEVPLIASGTAEASDINEALSIILPAGQTSVSIDFTAATDGNEEGIEELTLNLPADAEGFAAGSPSSIQFSISDPVFIPAEVALSDLVARYDGSGKSISVTTDPEGLLVDVTYDGLTDLPVELGSYAVVATISSPGYVGSSAGTFSIVNSYDFWISTFTDLGAPNTESSDDLDGDGWDNASEYAFGTSPDDGSSLPALVPTITDTKLQLMVPEAPEGITWSGETSINLDAWTTDGVTSIDGGFEVTLDGAQRFLRLVYDYDPGTPPQD